VALANPYETHDLPMVRDLAYRPIKKAKLALSVASSVLSMQSRSSLPPDADTSDTINIDALASDDDDPGDERAGTVPDVDPEQELSMFYYYYYYLIVYSVDSLLAVDIRKFWHSPIYNFLTTTSQFNTTTVGFVTSSPVRRASARCVWVGFDASKTQRISLLQLTLGIILLGVLGLKHLRTLHLLMTAARAAQSSLPLPAKGRYPSRSHAECTLTLMFGKL
jgi:hypothetical protein